MFKEFKEFINRGNLIEIAVGLVIALAFKAVVDAFVQGLLMPLVAAIFLAVHFWRIRKDGGISGPL